MKLIKLLALSTLAASSFGAMAAGTATSKITVSGTVVESCLFEKADYPLNMGSSLFASGTPKNVPINLAVICQTDTTVANLTATRATLSFVPAAASGVFEAGLFDLTGSNEISNGGAPITFGGGAEPWGVYADPNRPAYVQKIEKLFFVRAGRVNAPGGGIQAFGQSGTFTGDIALTITY